MKVLSLFLFPPIVSQSASFILKQCRFNYPIIIPNIFLKSVERKVMKTLLLLTALLTIRSFKNRNGNRSNFGS